MKITKREDILNVNKPEGINVWYYLFDEYEVHFNEQNPHTEQTWHHHEKIWECLDIIEGELLARWRENGSEKEEIVREGDLIETEYTPHTFINNSDQVVKFLIMKQILNGENKKDLLKNDKVLD